MSEYLIPHPNVPTTDIGSAKLKESVVLFNENFLVLDSQAQTNASAISTLDSDKAAADHNHDSEYAEKDHTHSMQEIDSLVDNLELKAPLVHTHDQYLTTMPSHTHEESEVNNLITDLAGKAAADHTHAMSDVTGLSTELADKATQTQVGMLASMIPEKSSQGTASAVGDVPADVVAEPANETIAQKNARVGTSTKYARADHKHVYGYDGSTTAPTSDKVLMCKKNGTAVTWEDAVSNDGVSGDFIDGANITSDSSGDPSSYFNPTSIDTSRLTNLRTTWNVGDTDSSGEKVGVKLTVCTGIMRLPSASNGSYYAHFSNLYFDKNGLLTKVETAQNLYRV